MSSSGSAFGPSRNPFDLTGKSALVTGGNGGLGLGIALGFARGGARVCIAGRNAEKSAAAAREITRESGLETVVVTADLAHADQVERCAAEAVAALGRIDILVNNAGINIRKPPDALSLEEWRIVLDVNLTSAFLLAKAVYPAMKQAGGGKIINIGSMASTFGAAFAPAYAASKGAIVQLTKSLAIAWAGDGIQVNAILPGWFNTELNQGLRRQFPAIGERALARIPEGRWGEPEDLAGTAVWLASSASDYVTGVAVPVDGGFTVSL